MLAALGYFAAPVAKVIALGNVNLLRMDVTQASRFWGVPNPIGRRDQKSGDRKRRQTDIELVRLSAVAAE